MLVFRSFVDVILIFSLLLGSAILPSGGMVLASTGPLEDHLTGQQKPIFTESKVFSEFFQDGIKALSESHLTDSEELIDSFIEALASSGDEKQLMNLASVMGHDSENFVKLIERLIEKSADHPEIMNLVDENSLSLSQFIDNHKTPRVGVGEKVYEMFLFSVSYLIIVHTVHSYSSNNFAIMNQFLFSYQPLAVLLILSAMRQYTSFKFGFKAYLSQLKQKKKARQFVSSFRAWLADAKEFSDFKSLLLTIKLNKYRFMGESSDKERKRLFGRFLELIAGMKKTKGLYSSFVRMTKTSKVKKKVKALLEKVDYQALNFRLSGLDDIVVKLNLKKHKNNIYQYDSIKREVTAWLLSNDQNSLAELRRVALEERQSHQLSMIAKTKLTRLDYYNIQALTVGTIIFSGLMALGSDVVPEFQQFFPQGVLDFAKQEHNFISLMSLFLPATALMLHEFEYVRYLLKNKSSTRRDIKMVNDRLEGLVQSLSSIEWEAEKDGLQASVQRESGFDRQLESTRNFVRRMSGGQYLQREAPGSRIKNWCTNLFK